MSQLASLQVLITGSTWLLTFAVHSFIAQAIALLAGRFLVRSPRFCSSLYRVALLLPLLTATALTAGVRPPAPVAEINLPALAREQAGAASSTVLVRERVLRAGDGTSRVDSFATDSVALTVAFIAAVLAAITALAGIARMCARYLAFRSRLGARARHPVNGGRLSPGYRVTMSPALGAPVAIGLREICVPPATFDGLSEVERESVLAHESAHLARRDPLWFALGDALVALFPWQPLARLHAREARRTAEFCCDDAVLRAVGNGRALVRSLAAFAAGFDPAETALAASCGGSPLEERARRLLAPSQQEGRAAGAWWAALVLALLFLVVAAAPAVSTRSRQESLRHDGTIRRVLIQEINTAR